MLMLVYSPGRSPAREGVAPALEPGLVSPQLWASHLTFAGLGGLLCPSGTRRTPGLLRMERQGLPCQVDPRTPEMVTQLPCSGRFLSRVSIPPGERGCLLLRMGGRGGPGGRLPQEARAMWLAEGARIEVASHTPVTTLPPPHASTSTPAPSHPHAARSMCVRLLTHIHTPPAPAHRPPRNVALPQARRAQPAGHTCPCQKPSAGGPCSCVSHPGRASCGRPSVSAYNLHVLTQPFPSSPAITTPPSLFSSALRLPVRPLPEGAVQ